MEIEGGDITGISILVGCKRVDGVWKAVLKRLWRLKGSVWDERSVDWHVVCKISWTMRLPNLSAGYNT